VRSRERIVQYELKLHCQRTLAQGLNKADPAMMAADSSEIPNVQNSLCRQVVRWIYSQVRLSLGIHDIH
jgi:hypothetical protein